MLAEEADELSAGIRAVGIGVGLFRGTTRPAMSPLVDIPVLGEATPRAVLIGRAGEGLPARHLPAARHRGRRGAVAKVRQARRQDVVYQVRSIGMGDGRIQV